MSQWLNCCCQCQENQRACAASLRRQLCRVSMMRKTIAILLLATIGGRNCDQHWLHWPQCAAHASLCISLPLVLAACPCCADAYASHIPGCIYMCLPTLCLRHVVLSTLLCLRRGCQVCCMDASAVQMLAMSAPSAIAWQESGMYVACCSMLLAGCSTCNACAPTAITSLGQAPGQPQLGLSGLLAP